MTSELRAQMMGLPWPYSPRQWFLAKALALAEHPEVYWGVGVVLGALVLGSAWRGVTGCAGEGNGRWFGGGSTPAPDGKDASPRWTLPSSDGVFVALALAFIAFWRWPGLGLGHLNVDEDQALWGLARYAIDPVTGAPSTGRRQVPSIPACRSWP